MDDKTYIALLEELLDDRKAYINELIEICGNLVKERDELAERLDQCETDYENMRDNCEQSCDHFDDLLDDYHILDQEHSSTLKEKQELEKDVVKLEGMVERRDEKVKKLRCDITELKDLADIRKINNDILERSLLMLKEENEYLKKELDHLNSIIDGENA